MIKTFTFDQVRQIVSKNFERLAATGQLFYVAIDRDQIWNEYITGFSPADRQEHECNSCKSFLRQFGGIVAIEDNQMISLWDLPELDGTEFEKSMHGLRDYVHSGKITDIFLTDGVAKCGTDKNFDSKREIFWTHLSINLLQHHLTKYICKRIKRPGLPDDTYNTALAAARDDRNVLKRSLEELTLSATETILELIAQDSLYRGKESEAQLKRFQELQKEYWDLPGDEKECFTWAIYKSAGSALCRIRNTAIGTLLIDLSEGMDLDSAVSRFESKVAPMNYKRPQALVTPKMVEQAKETLKGLGLLESLERRYANETDVSMTNVLFADRPTLLTDVFDEVAKDTTVNPRSFSKVEEIGIEEFIKNVVPGAKSIHVMLENSHFPNMVSLLTAQNPEAPSLFKWDNPFSWNYTGQITDSIKERVKEAGGRVDGELRTSLSWFNYDDLDIHVIEPGNNEIFYGRKRGHASGGALDVDMNAGFLNRSKTPVENIIWPDKSFMREGAYRIGIHNFAKRETSDQGFIVQVECRGEVFDFEYKANPQQGMLQIIADFEYSRADGIKFKGETKSNVVSRQKWGIKSNQFHKVTRLMLSPNHWGSREAGNRHYLLMLENCVSDETPRPFFNEFLKPELDQHRKVFEILGSKVKVPETTNQLSGLGFSYTKRASVIAKAQGKFTRALRVNF